ncbi:hypothetical protein [Marinobacter profundi]|uniref:hypothetical protein n=1 Tax=Marinobacter profundi TaxID=2666256 RepID=UPI001180FF28|nr:hypothetical protein [Marinobacter profundi]
MAAPTCYAEQSFAKDWQQSALMVANTPWSEHLVIKRGDLMKKTANKSIAKAEACDKFWES